MSDELAAVDPASPPAPEDSRLRQWARDAHDAHTVAQSLARTVFVPPEMQHRPDLVTAAILTGQEIGLEPMAALRSIDIIKGVPTMRATTMRGLVQAAGHEVWADEDSNASRAIVYGRRKGETTVQRSTWSMDRARDLGIAERDNYRKQPAAMLIARATAELCRLIASDVLLGMPYASEEIDTDETDAPTTPRKSRKRTAKRQPTREAPDLAAPDRAASEADAAEPEATEQHSGGESGGDTDTD